MEKAFITFIVKGEVVGELFADITPFPGQTWILTDEDKAGTGEGEIVLIKSVHIDATYKPMTAIYVTCDSVIHPGLEFPDNTLSPPKQLHTVMSTVAKHGLMPDSNSTLWTDELKSKP